MQGVLGDFSFSSVFGSVALFFVGAVVSGMEALGINQLVSDYQLDILLEKHNLKSSFNSGKISCAGCGAVITKNTLGLIVDKASPDFLCRTPDCSFEYNRKIAKFN